ncbi:MAG: hypothetical protein A3A43_01615 [Candidatus Liptonbacteria bacterium RIFCSPLOWO2_01_FULL_56_20]|uniref:DoxX family protein n=1 Tax=Candidatus Liptonbacteria bacterium RIFCSPLOWO2_01_FULL_56_20 TaxID=1798652 RepID=A0A1G2CK06_9BACT|nr:MAG: DoxX family protein [Parcubacteria group bacterium GW2011_GWB1_56_8]OGZ01587.1 MAG: hypothetical protein A3A43_01615 [Candidatus Liptonbacteria bacterium RIFCSPLOWO2_01_FULL_56_20]
MISQFFLLYNDHAILVLRLVLGAILIAHGLPKLRNLRGTSRDFEAMGFKPGVVFGPLAAILESFGGLAIAVGFATQVAAGLFGVEFLAITVWKFLRHEPLIGGIELDIILLAAALLLLTQGGGWFSLDTFWRVRF